MTFVYYYHADSSKEVIGRVQASGMDNAREQIAVIKQLDINLIDDLFVIESLDSHENNI
jgi:hypothetical protein